MRLIDADAYSAEMKDRQEAAWKWRNEAIAEEDEVKLARAEGAFTAFTEAKLTMDKHIINPWHRVEEELPEIGQIVLVYDNWDRLSICQLDNQYRWLRQGGGWFDVPYVRYWMPIEPPKEDA